MKSTRINETVAACLEPFSLPTSLKLQTKDYQTHGAFPIIDQGQELIAGWTDNPDGVISSPLPRSALARGCPTTGVPRWWASGEAPLMAVGTTWG